MTPPKPTPAQVERAGRLRRRIDALQRGERPAPVTPRELTDDAAREEAEAERRDGRDDADCD